MLLAVPCEKTERLVTKTEVWLYELIYSIRLEDLVIKSSSTL